MTELCTEAYIVLHFLRNGGSNTLTGHGTAVSSIKNVKCRTSNWSYVRRKNWKLDSTYATDDFFVCNVPGDMRSHSKR